MSWHTVVALWMELSISLDVLCFSFKNWLDQTVHIEWIHLAISGHHHADERGIEHGKQVLMAPVNGCANPFAMPFQKNDFTGCGLSHIHI